MKNIYIGSYQIHDCENVVNGLFINENLGSGIEGMELPSIRLSSVDKGGEDGAYISNQLYGGRIVSMEGGIRAPTASLFYTYRRGLENALKVERDGNGIPVLKLLKFKTRDNYEYQIPVYLKSMSMLSQRFNFIPFRIDLFAPFPFFQSQTEMTVVLGAGTSGGLVYPYDYPIVYGANNNTGAAINNGNANVFPVITLTGVLDDPVLVNIATGAYMAIEHTFIVSDVMVIDMQNKTITLNGAPALSTKALASVWWYLAPGSNTIQLTTSDSSDTGTATIVYRDTYIGI